jgi:hypothetical protein
VQDAGARRFPVVRQVRNQVQNMPSRIALTNANEAHTASRLIFQVKSTPGLRRC